MKLEDALEQLRAGATIEFAGTTVTDGADGVWLSKQDLLSDKWKVLVTDEQIIAVWEEDARIREKTGQPAQAALLRDCIKTLRTRLLP